MASRNFHKRRTKERKERQAAAKLALAREYSRKRRHAPPDILTGPALSVAAAALLFGPRTLRR